MFEEAVLTHSDTSRRLSNSKHWESHLFTVEYRGVATVVEQWHTFETQLSIILGISSPAKVLVGNRDISESHIPVASLIPSHRWRETVFEYKCFLRYRETPLRNLSSPTNFDSMRSTIAVLQWNQFNGCDKHTGSSFGV